MSDKMRWRWSDTNTVKAAVDSATVIENGDILYQDIDNARPASAQVDQHSLSVSQDLLVRNFLGVAMQASCKGETKLIRVATTGVFEFDCVFPRPVELGALMGVDKPESGIGLTNQTVAVVIGPLAPDRAIGRVAKREPAGATTVLIDIRSQVMGISL